MRILSKKTAILFVLLFIVVSIYANSRQKISISEQWKFEAKIENNTPASTSFNDASWQWINIPHTWNPTDAQDGGNDYLRTVGWYRKTIPWSNNFEGKKIYIEFLAANMQAECFVNGVSVGSHKGGYTAFRFDITEQLQKGDNLIAVKVDNRHSEEIIPLSGDFSFYGGIYRDVSLIVANSVHVALMDNGSSGLYLTTRNVSAERADLEVKAEIINTSNVPQQITIQAVLKHPESFTEIKEVPNPAFNPEDMYSNSEPLKVLTETVTIPANGRYQFKQTTRLNNPRLWNGKTDPYRYQLDFSISQNSNVIDELSDFVGFRYFSITNDGFFLNGKLYPLRGVNRHQDRENMGNAISKEHHDEDFGMMYEIGANSFRLAHYPQDPYMYELCDRYGIVVWAEIAFVDFVGTSPTFKETTKLQLLELIRQQYNRPSIVMWGLQNEVRGNYDAEMRIIMKELNDLAHAEDPSRLTVQATNHGTANNWDSDLMAWNRYPRWYGTGGSVANLLDGYRNASRPTGLSEYGAGGSIYQHELNPPQPQHNGPWHPEEYQSQWHEDAIIDISTRDFIWGTFVWNMFDFGSDWRAEGDRHGVNDKGLVTFDRKIKKDSYFAYKVNWNPEPEIHISGRRYVNRTESLTPIKVYSNCEIVELFVNGVSQGTKAYQDTQCGFFSWEDIFLPAGENKIEAKGKIGDKYYTDEVVWNREIGHSTELISEELQIDNEAKEVILIRDVPIKDLHNFISGVNNASFKVFENDGVTPVTDGLLEIGMRIIVTAEDGVTQASFLVVPIEHIAFKKPVYTDSEENDNPVNHIVDGNLNTRWAARDKNPHWVEIDLEKEYLINGLKVVWYYPDTNRYYQYLVTVGDQIKAYQEVIDRRNNTTGNITEDKVEDTVGRYLKIDVTHSSSGYPSIYEIEIYGWTMESDVYTIDLRNKIISIPQAEGGEILMVSDFLNNIVFYGNQEHNVQSISYFLQEDDKLIVTDHNQEEIEFTITFRDADRVISKNKPVYFSGEEGVSDNGEETLGAFVNDGDLATRWAAPKRNGKAFYPEWIMIDLEDQYKIEELELFFYRYGEDNRSYGYEVLFSNEDTRDDTHFRVITDATNNVDKSGHHRHFYQNKTARYVKVNVTACSLTQSWALASINEIIVKGKSQTVSVEELDNSNSVYVYSEGNNLIVKVDDPFRSVQMDIFNVSGQRLISCDIQQEFRTTLEKGIYFITINTVHTQSFKTIKHLIL